MSCYPWHTERRGLRPTASQVSHPCPSPARSQDCDLGQRGRVPARHEGPDLQIKIQPLPLMAPAHLIPSSWSKGDHGPGLPTATTPVPTSVPPGASWKPGSCPPPPTPGPLLLPLALLGTAFPRLLLTQSKPGSNVTPENKPSHALLSRTAARSRSPCVSCPAHAPCHSAVTFLSDWLIRSQSDALHYCRHK